MADRTSGGVTNRRYGALHRLEAQLKTGEKELNTKKAREAGWEKDPTGVIQLLSEGDIKRIQKEIHSLKSKLGLITKVSKEDAAIIADSLANPAEPNEALKRVNKNYQSFKNQ